MPRSTVCLARDRDVDEPAERKERGPKTELSYEELVERIREVLQENDYLGEGHREVRIRLRQKGTARPSR